MARAFGSVAVTALFLGSVGGGVVAACELPVDKSAAELWGGQYECVSSLPLSAREIAISLATLAAVRPFAGAKAVNQAPPSAVRRSSIAVSARD